MSAADVEVVREMYAAFNRGDYEGAAAILHPDAELHQPPEIPGADVYRGREEFVRGLGHWQAAFEPGFQYEIVELLDGPNAVFMQLVLRGRGRASGAEVEQPSFNVWEMREGRPFRCRIYSDAGAAREAAGLSR